MAGSEIKKRVDNCVWYTDGTIRVDGCRVSFPHLAKAYAGKNDKGEAQAAKYGIVGMLDKKTHVAAKDLIVEAMNALLDQFKDKEGNRPKVAGDKKFIRNGDDQERAEYTGYWTISAREARRPNVRDGKGNLLDPVKDSAQIAEMIYAGCYAHIMIRPWYQDGVSTGAGYGKRVNAGLVTVQFYKKGEPFGEGRIDDSDAWGDAPQANDSDDGMGNSKPSGDEDEL